MFCLESRTTTTIHCVCFALSLSLRLRAQAAGSRPGFSLSLSLKNFTCETRARALPTPKIKTNPTQTAPTSCRAAPLTRTTTSKQLQKKSHGSTSPATLPLALPPTTRPLGQSRPLLRRLALDLVVSHLKWFPLALGAPMPPPPRCRRACATSTAPLLRPRGRLLRCFFFFFSCFFLRPRKRFILSSTFNRGTPEEVPSSNPNSSGSVRFFAAISTTGFGFFFWNGAAVENTC